MINRLPPFDYRIAQETDSDCSPKALQVILEFLGIPLTSDIKTFLQSLTKLAETTGEAKTYIGLFPGDIARAWGEYAKANYRRGREPFTMEFPESTNEGESEKLMAHHSGEGSALILNTVTFAGGHALAAFREGTDAVGRTMYRVVSPGFSTRTQSGAELARSLNHRFPYQPMLVIRRNGKVA